MSGKRNGSVCRGHELANALYQTGILRFEPVLTPLSVYLERAYDKTLIDVNIWVARRTQAAHSRFGKIVPTFKAAYKLNLSHNINAKIWLKCQENLPSCGAPPPMYSGGGG